jgi:hypothetical protein
MQMYVWVKADQLLGACWNARLLEQASWAVSWIRQPMSTDARAALETAATTETDADAQSIDELEQRDVRALTECMTVLPDGAGTDLYTVIGQHENGEYRVDARTDRCTCPDHEYRDARCKHARRVAFATGAEPIPAAVDRDAVDSELGAHVEGEPRFLATDGGTEIVDAGDEGELLEPADDDTDPADVDERPDDCQCAPFLGDLPCWPCYREGFDEPNPAAAEEGDDDV